MAIIVGQGDYKYEIKENWAKLPDGWSFKEVAAVGVDKNDNVYAFGRGEHPMMVFDRDGNFLRSWGEGQYPRAHGVHMGPDDSIYLTDDGGHFVRKCSLDGKVLLELGVPGTPAPYLSGEPFNRCTHTALSPKGEIYVSDGYGNARVHKYSPDGKLLDVVGRARQRSRPVQPRPQHLRRRRRLGLCRRPREPPRPGVRRQRQVRDAVEQSAPAVRALHALRASAGLLYRRAFGQPPQRQSRAAGQHRRQPGQAVVAHRRPVCRDGADLVYRAARPRRRFSRGDLYVGEVCWTLWPGLFPGQPHPAGAASLTEIRTRALTRDRHSSFRAKTGTHGPLGVAERSPLDPRFRGGDDQPQRRNVWRPSSGKATTSTGSSRIGRNCPTAGRSRRSARSASTPRTTSMCSTAATTRSWCSTATASSCARGARASIRAPTASIWAPDDSIYLTDDGGHFVRKCSLDGKVLLELGVPGKPAPYMSGEPFHRCTHTALSPKGEIYVSDGYGNAKVHKYSPDGKLLMSWGEPGTNPGEFNIVHNICTDADGWVYVADRENHRIQVFDGNGKYEAQWNNLHRPCGLYMDYTRHPVAYIGEFGPGAAGQPQQPEPRARGSASSTIRASCCRGSATCMPGPRRPRFSARTG